jgi:hypothetical protein
LGSVSLTLAQRVVKEIVIPNCVKVGHLHRLEYDHRGWIVHDSHDYADIEISDERFAELVNNPNQYDAHNQVAGGLSPPAPTRTQKQSKERILRTLRGK